MKIDAVRISEQIKEKLHNSSDFKTRNVQFFGISIVICYIADMTDNDLFNESLLNPLLNYDGQIDDNIVDTLKDKVLSNNEVEEFFNLDEAIDNMLTGYSLLLVDNADRILSAPSTNIKLYPVNNLSIASSKS